LPRETVVLHGDVPREIEVHEYGVKFLAAPWTGQKTGAFLDQRENRHFVGTVARGRALDCFSYHGSFALHLARNATHVTALDASGPALVRAAENAARNSLENISFVEANAFDYLREKDREGITFDTIVLDPPAFAKTRAAIPGAMRGYKDINLRGDASPRPRRPALYRELQLPPDEAALSGDAAGRGRRQRTSYRDPRAHRSTTGSPGSIDHSGDGLHQGSAAGGDGVIIRADRLGKSKWSAHPERCVQ